MSRIKGNKIALDQNQVARFFEERAKKFDHSKPLTSILYQDAHPEIAERRDALERERILPLLRLTGSEKVLDVGCGIGRWANAIWDQIASYHGVDASRSLIEIANKISAHPNATFHMAGTDDLTDGWLTANGPFDRVIFSGILIYLDDAQLSSVLKAVGRHLSPGAIVYIREPMGMLGRLTLSDHWSDELNASYNAIYRSPEEIVTALEEAFPSSRFQISPPTLLFEDAGLNNRAETQQHFCIVEKVG